MHVGIFKCMLMWSHPGDSWYTHVCMCVCLWSRLGDLWYTHVRAAHGHIWRDLGAHTLVCVQPCVCVCVSHVVILRPWCTHVLCVHVMWSHPGDLGVHVCLCVCMPAGSHPAPDKSSAEMGLPVLDAQSQSVFTSCLTPCSSTRPRGEGVTGKGGRVCPLEVIGSWACPHTGSGARWGRTGSTNPDVRGGCMGIPGVGLAPVGAEPLGW